MTELAITDDDDDGDGWLDTDEATCGSDSNNSASYPIDTDSDGVCNSIDDDDDDGCENYHLIQIFQMVFAILKIWMMMVTGTTIQSINSHWAL